MVNTVYFNFNKYKVKTNVTNDVQRSRIANKLTNDVAELINSITFRINSLTPSQYGKSKLFLFLDFETDNLDVQVANLYEVNVLITLFNKHTRQFDVIADINTVFNSEINVNNMGSGAEWILKTHGGSGLLGEVAKSGVSYDDFNYLLKEVIPAVKTAIMGRGIQLEDGDSCYSAVICGSGVHFDKRILDKHFPFVSDMVSYQLIDTTTFYLSYKLMGIEREGAGDETARIHQLTGNSADGTHKHRSRFDNYLSLLRLTEYLNNLSVKDKPAEIIETIEPNTTETNPFTVTYGDVRRKDGSIILEPTGTNLKVTKPL